MCFFKKRKARKQAELAKKEEARVVEEKVVEEPVVAEKKEPVAEAKPAPEEPKAEENKVEAKAAKYHISQNKDEDSTHFKEWRVRKEGSNKTIKFFKTQVEAIEFAKGLADNQESSIVIHKVDGSIRKQDYAKKD